jgi:hypothetical protein
MGKDIQMTFKEWFIEQLEMNEHSPDNIMELHRHYFSYKRGWEACAKARDFK